MKFQNNCIFILSTINFRKFFHVQLLRILIRLGIEMVIIEYKLTVVVRLRSYDHFNYLKMTLLLVEEEITILQRILWVLNTLFHNILAIVTFFMLWILFENNDSGNKLLWHAFWSTIAVSKQDFIS